MVKVHDALLDLMSRTFCVVTVRLPGSEVFIPLSRPDLKPENDKTASIRQNTAKKEFVVFMVISIYEKKLKIRVYSVRYFIIRLHVYLQY